jgi:hypothetical protein
MSQTEILTPNMVSACGLGYGRPVGHSLPIVGERVTVFPAAKQATATQPTLGRSMFLQGADRFGV